MPSKSTAGKSRILVFDGVINFRQLGGYKAGDGRRVRRGMLFRSEHLGHLSDADLERLRGLGLRCICDLRSQRECAALPDRFPRHSQTRVVHLGIEQRDLVSPATAEVVSRPEATAEDFFEGMRESYRRMVSHCTYQFAALLRLYCDHTSLPILVHCTGGKDRTGFAAAILLSALGVPRRTVFNDYLLTNRLAERRTGAGCQAPARALYPQAPGSPLQPLFTADRLYLQESFAEIDRRYGSFDLYLRQGLSVSDEQRKMLQDRLLV